MQQAIYTYKARDQPNEVACSSRCFFIAGMVSGEYLPPGTAIFPSGWRHIHDCVFVRVCVCVCVCVHACVCAWACVCVLACMYLCMHACMCICVCMCAHVHAKMHACKFTCEKAWTRTANLNIARSNVTHQTWRENYAEVLVYTWGNIADTGDKNYIIKTSQLQPFICSTLCKTQQQQDNSLASTVHHKTFPMA